VRVGRFEVENDLRRGWLLLFLRLLTAAPIVAFVGHAIGRIAQALIVGFGGSVGLP
jgi:hypothetical protein